MRIRKGDIVKILTGKDRGKTGKVIRIDSKNAKVTVGGLNLYKKHVRPKRQGEKGQIIQVVRPIDLSNVALICENCGRAIRVGYRLEDGKKVRCCRKCQSVF